jgi:hypothetical protein
MKEPDIIRDCVSFTQEGDCCGDGQQSLIVREEDGGGGSYYVIETERWAFDSIYDLIAVLKRAGCRDVKPEGWDEGERPSGQRIATQEV